MGKWYFQKYEKKGYGMGVNIVPKNITLCKYFWTVVISCFIFHYYVIGREVLVPVYNFLDALYNKKPIKWPKIKSISNFEFKTKHLKMIFIPFLMVVGISHVINENWFFAAIQFAFVLMLIFSKPIAELIVVWKFKRYRIKLIKEEKQKDKPPHHNLALEYIKARKGKYCPILQFYEPVDDEVLR